MAPIFQDLRQQAEGIYYMSFRNSVKIKAIPEYTVKFKRHSYVLYIEYKGAVLFLDKCIGCLFRIENRISHGITNNDHLFSCPIINTATIHCANLLIYVDT